MFFNPNLKKILFLSLFFTIAIFFIKYYFLDDDNYNISNEENYIDRSIDENSIELNIEDLETPNLTETIKSNTERNIILEKYKENIIKKVNNTNNISYIYIPSVLRWKIRNHIKNISFFVTSSYFFNKIEDLTVEFYKDLIDVRWKMKNKKIKLFWPIKMWKEELLSVFIHELWHYIDLYFFNNTRFWDTSNNFYKISWNSTKIMKKWQKGWDFVSWYSMTNKYEDFAESFNYYILHNKDFLQKTKKSIFLKEKYKFFRIYLFNRKEFVLTDFWNNSKIKDYYRDTTKIWINLNKILQYLWK